jgi:hypothetical protein
MNKDDLIKTLESSRIAFMDAIEDLSEDQLTQPGICGEWSIKDLMAHLLMWEAETIKLLFQVQQGKVPTTVHLSQLSDDEQNALWRQQIQNRPLQAVLDDFHAIRAQTIRQIQAISEERLSNPKLFPWLKGKTLTELILHSISQHDDEHRAQIEAWRSTQN